MNLPGRICAKIDLSAIEENLRSMREKMEDQVMVCAVVKTNGYGHGAETIARRLQPYPYLWGFAVATSSEAEALRQAGITKPILILGYVFEEDDELLLEEEFRPALFTMEMARRLSEKAFRRGRVLPVHIALDTGMSRIGLPDDPEGVQTALRMSALPGLRIEGLFTHFARADEADKTDALGAFARYQRFARQIQAAGLTIPIHHCANSAGILEMAGTHLDMVRAGITLYGIYPSDEMDRSRMALRPAMELKSHVAFVKEVAAGTPISYGGTYVTPAASRIATIPAGYGDGYPRSLSNRGYVLICGRRAPIRGRVCMDQFMVDVTGIPEAAQGDEVTLMGRDGDAFLSVEELSSLSGRFPYEFVCDISPRVPRIYVG